MTQSFHVHHVCSVDLFGGWMKWSAKDSQRSGQERMVNEVVSKGWSKKWSAKDGQRSGQERMVNEVVSKGWLHCP